MMENLSLQPCTSSVTPPIPLILQKKKQYGNSFAIHGLTRSIQTKKWESVFWSGLLVIACISSFVIIYRLTEKFRAYPVYTEIRFQMTDLNYFPSVTFCEKELLTDSYFAYCGLSSVWKWLNDTVTNKHCTGYESYKKSSITHVHNKYWASEMFNFTECVTHHGFTGGHHHCNSNQYLKSLQHLNNSCVTWNYAGDYSDPYSHVDLAFKFMKPSYCSGDTSIFAVLHDPDIEELEITHKIDMSLRTHYDVKIDKTVVKRLPSPFPSNCYNVEADHMLRGKYSRYACIEWQYYIEMYKRCGDIFDYMRQYIPADIKGKYKRNVTIGETMKCIRDVGARVKNSSFDCKTPCENLELNIVSYSHLEEVSDAQENEYFISIHLYTHGAYKVMEEKALYSWMQMLCRAGGFIGLVMGMSVVAFVEIFVYVCLSISAKIM